MKQIQESDKQPPKRLRPLCLAIAAVLVIGAAAGGYFIVKGEHSKTNNPAIYEKGLHNEAYSKLSSFKLNGLKAGDGIVFNKPAAYVKVLETADHTQASFSHTLKSPPAPLGALHVLSVAASSITPAGINDLNKMLSAPGQPSYEAAVQPLKEFLSARFSPLYAISYRNARPLASAALHDHAWRLDFSAAPKQMAKPAPGETANSAASVDPAHAQPLPQGALAGLEDYKGSVAMIIGNNAYYYFLVYNTNYNWDNNVAIFTGILENIKVNQ